MTAAPRSLIVVGLAAWGCGSGEDAGPDAGSLPRIVVSSTVSYIDTNFNLYADGHGAETIGSVMLDRHIGRVTVYGAPHYAVAYDSVPYPDQGFTSFRSLVVARDRWYVVWLYCVDGQMPRIWFEGTDGTPMSSEAGTGSCQSDASGGPQLVQLPSVDMPYPALEANYTLSGADLQYDGVNPGSVVLDGAEMVLLPFESVSCTAGCGSGGLGWEELHAIVYDPQAQRGCFGIFYLQFPGTVDLSYLICLPDLAVPFGSITYDATWTTPP